VNPDLPVLETVQVVAQIKLTRQRLAFHLKVSHYLRLLRFGEELGEVGEVVHGPVRDESYH